MGRRPLSDDERQLWGRVVRDVRRRDAHHPHADRHEFEAMHHGVGDKGPARVAPSSGATPGSPHANPQISHQIGQAQQPSRGRSAPMTHNAKVHVPKTPALGAGDPKLDRLAGRNRILIERTLDLHGHTQETARMIFHRFLKMAYADHCRCLLVITGKGGAGSSSNLSRIRLSGFQHGQRGVLKERVAEWSDADDLRGLISRIAPAQRHHGGDGAYYVFLKANRR